MNMNDINRECPKCGRRITKTSTDGRIGFCEYHEEWFPFFPDAQGEASEANRKYKASINEKKDEEIRRKLHEEKARKNKRRRKILFRLFFVSFVLVLAVILIMRYKVIPEKYYQEAEQLFEEGQYAEARLRFTDLNGYSDSNDKSIMCEALLMVDNGDTDKALTILSDNNDISENEAFMLIYNAVNDRCTSAKSKASAYDVWKEFGLAYSDEMEKYGLKQDFAEKENTFKLLYADQLAQEKDSACVELYAELSNSKSIDVEDHIVDALENTIPGLSKIELRELLISVLEANGKDTSAQKTALTEELFQYINEWQDIGLSVESTYELLEKAFNYGVQELDFADISKDLGLEKIKAEKKLSGYLYKDLDGDGIDELIISATDGVIASYRIYLSFSEISAIDIELEAPTLEEINELVLVTSDDESGFAVVSPDNEKLDILWLENDVVDFQRESTIITYGKEIQGSIDRSIRYRYSLEDPGKDPELTHIEWGKEDYRYPETPEQTVQRLFEARGYGIVEEEKLLISSSDLADQGFSLAALSALPLPEQPYVVTSSVYGKEGDIVFLETMYESEKQTVVKYFAVQMDEESKRWKVAGVGDTFAIGMENSEINYGIGLVEINSDTVGHLKSRDAKEAYRVLLTEPSKVQIIWKAGEKQGRTTAFTVELYDGNDMTDSVISYDLNLSASKQVSRPLFLPAGVYYIQVSAKKYEDIDYHLTFQVEEDAYSEQESNNSTETANQIELNRAYSASLFEKADEDWFEFTVETPGMVKVNLSAEENTIKRSQYTVKLIESSEEQVLSQYELPDTQGNMEPGNIYLDAGNYYIQVYKGSGWTAAEYKIEVDYSEVANAEREGNNAFEKATNIQINQEIVGSFGSEEDIDYYSFDVEKDVIIQPKLSFRALETSHKAYVLTLYGNNRALYSANIGGQESDKVLVPFSLSKGTYYLKIENPNFNSKDYVLYLTAQAVDKAEIEPNDELANATKLDMGKIYTGVISTEDDIDYYKISFAEEATVTLSFQFTPITGSNRVFSIQLEQNGKKLWSEHIVGASGGITQKLQIPAGDYYLRVKSGSSWTGSFYTLVLNL